MRRNKILLTICAAVLLLSITLTGCNPESAVTPSISQSPTASQPPATTPPPEITNAAELVAVVKQAAAGVKSYRVETNNSYVVDDHNAGGGLVMTSAALVDLSRSRYYQDRFTISGGPTESKTRIETYWVDEWAYSINDPTYAQPYSSTGVWYKYLRSGDEAVPPVLSPNQLILNAFDTVTVTILGSERVNGVDCYKVGMTGDYSALFPVDPELLSNINAIFWVGKNDFHITMFSISYRLAQDGGVIDIRMSAIYSQFNQVSVSLPPAALNAIETQPPPTIPLLTSQPKENVQEIIASMKQAAAGLKSLRSEMNSGSTRLDSAGKTTTSAQAIVLADLAHQRYYLDQNISGTLSGVTPPQSSYLPEPAGRMQLYLMDSIAYQRFDRASGSLESGVWYKSPAQANASLLLYNQVILKTLETATFTMSTGVFNGIECHTFNITNGYSNILPWDPAMLSDFRFFVWVDKATFQILSVIIDYRLTQNGVVTDTHQQFIFSQFNQVAVTLPPEALTAAPPPSPPPSATLPAS